MKFGMHFWAPQKEEQLKNYKDNFFLFNEQAAKLFFYSNRQFICFDLHTQGFINVLFSIFPLYSYEHISFNA